MGTSYFSNAEYLYSYIEANDTEKASELIKNHPQLLNNQITLDSKCTALGRATFRGNYALCKLFLGMGAKPNVESNQQTPLMIASIRGNLPIVELLMEYQADPKLETQEKLNSLDFAVLYGNYNVASYFIMKHQMELANSAKGYEQIAIKKKIYYVNYKIMVDCLSKKFDEGSVPNLFERPPKPKLVDPVIDPNETWSHFIKRVSNFDPPPLVQRDTLPENMQPQNRLLGSLHYYIERLKGTNYLSLRPRGDTRSLAGYHSNRESLKERETQL